MNTPSTGVVRVVDVTQYWAGGEARSLLNQRLGGKPKEDNPQTGRER